MTLAAAPHPPSVFRYLKQAWREWILTGNASTCTIATPVTQAAALPLTVTGTVLVDGSVPKPVEVKVNLSNAAVFQAQQVTYSDKTTGAWTVTFPGGSTTATAAATVGSFVYSGDIPIGVVLSSNFTLT